MVQKEALEAVVDTMEEEVDMTVEEGEALGAEEEVVAMAVAVEVASVEAEEVEDLVVGGLGIEVGLVVVEEASDLKLYKEGTRKWRGVKGWRMLLVCSCSRAG